MRYDSQQCAYLLTERFFQEANYPNSGLPAAVLSPALPHLQPRQGKPPHPSVFFTFAFFDFFAFSDFFFSPSAATWSELGP